MDDLKVKGTLIVDLVKMIRKNKDKNWDKHLTPEDWKIINSRIIAFSWYPLSFYDKVGQAVFNVLAGKNFNVVRSGGKAIAAELFKGVYRSVITPNDPMQSLKKFIGVYERLFNFSPLKLEAVGENHVILQYDFTLLNNESNNSYVHQLLGILDTLMEMSAVRNAKIDLVQKKWENSPATVLEIQWG